jgi:hypothetical protein
MKKNVGVLYITMADQYQRIKKEEYSQAPKRNTNQIVEQEVTRLLREKKTLTSNEMARLREKFNDDDIVYEIERVLSARLCHGTEVHATHSTPLAVHPPNPYSCPTARVAMTAWTRCG